ncbi:Serine/threonine-protein kinase smg-1 [Talaromyces islandicus]|uniref:Serine/threonine-protein kinase smg-1 n=1 Tax=Talaromyces islandicus TaxID=28573 RepID=A0A0U1LK82_TALIS|nr:Serine/threonine-protein kinase smg-1 [Talaromyces islandicus]
MMSHKSSLKDPSVFGNKPKASPPLSPAQATKELVEKAKKISNWDATSTTADLKDFILTTLAFGKKGDRVVLVLIQEERTSKETWDKSLWASETALDLLGWLLENFRDAFDKKPDNKGQKESDISNRRAMHFAIDQKNYGFLVCFFSLPIDKLDKVKSIFECEEKERKNVVHLALETGVPFASSFIAVCSATALTKVDVDGYTPIHRGMRREDKAEMWVPSPPPSSKQSNNSIVIRREFVGRDILAALKERQDALGILPKVLTAVAQTGSLYEDLAAMKGVHRDTDPVLEELKGLIFQHLKSIQDATTALYGNSMEAKELCLDMSDFNRSSHDFEKFVDRLITMKPRNIKVDTDDDDTADSLTGMVSFEDTLFFVQLPDLNHVKQPCYQETIRKLFCWLADDQGVKTIKRLYIPDSSLIPLSDAFIARYVLDQFQIEAMDWRRLDLNLDVFTQGCPGSLEDAEQAPVTSWDTRKHIKELTLYSSGNWSVLYHWISEEGLAKLPELEKVVIEIVHLNPANQRGVHDENIRKYHRSMVAKYKNDLYTMHKEQQRYNAPFLNYRYALEIRLDARWDYPRSFQEAEEPTMSVPRFTSLLGPCKSFIEEQISQADGVQSTITARGDKQRNGLGKQDERHGLLDKHEVALKLYELTLLSEPDRRIKVAIIDNGADKIRSPIGPWIDKGISYVSSDRDGNTPRPWWMVADAHGTQMASLINNVNPYCRLYIARVGKGRDIDPKKAAKAIDWAVEQQVDIISMSWATKSNDNELKSAIENAAKSSVGSKRRPTLMFCSTADEGAFAGDVYPVNYTNFVVSVTATDNWGGLTSKADPQKKIDIRIPGEDLEASAPVYLPNAGTSVSGSSVATALAAGIASLALLLLRAYNHVEEDEAFWRFYTRNGIMGVFNRMDASKGALQVQHLFPSHPVDPSTLDAGAMSEKWNIRNFPE